MLERGKERKDQEALKEIILKHPGSPQADEAQKILDKQEDKKKWESGLKEFEKGISGLFSSTKERKNLGLKNVYERAMKHLDTEDETHLPTIFTPGHELQDRSIKMQTMLSDFLYNDPLIRRQNPQEVISLFSDMIARTPLLLDRPSVARMKLHSLIQEGLETPELTMQIQEMIDKYVKPELAQERGMLGRPVRDKGSQGEKGEGKGKGKS